jgi:hypothetical protein
MMTALLLYGYCNGVYSVCLDETSKQLTAETRLAIPMKPGRPARCDHEYERNGTPTSSYCSRRSKAGGASKSRIATPPWIMLTS